MNDIYCDECGERILTEKIEEHAYFKGHLHFTYRGRTETDDKNG